MNYDSAIAKLKTIKQEHLLHFFDTLEDKQKIDLLKQIDELDVALFRNQQQIIHNQRNVKCEKFEPFTSVTHEKDISCDVGIELLNKGKSGCLIVAGGLGTRLKITGPKGTATVSAVKHKSLFQIFAEKTLAAQKLYSHTLELAIMTSKENHDETLNFFVKHEFFGLNPSQISFFSQKNLPFLDIKGDLFLKSSWELATGPDGNGGSLHSFFESGIYTKWVELGIEFVNYILIDNPLANPFDAKLLSFQSRQKADIVVKCIRRQTPDESVGILVTSKKHLKVIEYSELTSEEKYKKDSHSNFIHLFANISLFSFSIEFIKKVATKTHELNLHPALKDVSFIDYTNVQKKQYAWKFEKFIFDVFPFSEHTAVLEYPREKTFAPLKNFEGANSLKTVQNALEMLDYETITHITGKKEAILRPFEIAQDFYYPTKELKEEWKNKTITGKHYIGAT
jgi:UDP-N-acetylglucosamine/UDP-N-acetylgalactosamine diphosphorylase